MACTESGWPSYLNLSYPIVSFLILSNSTSTAAAPPTALACVSDLSGPGLFEMGDDPVQDGGGGGFQDQSLPAVPLHQA